MYVCVCLCVCLCLRVCMGECVVNCACIFGTPQYSCRFKCLPMCVRKPSKGGTVSVCETFMFTVRLYYV